jgi:thioredoxin-like negative regulator of GroEL
MQPKILTIKAQYITPLLIILFICLPAFSNKSVKADTRQDEKPVTLVEFNKRIATKEKMVLIYFSADWCAVCIKMKPVMERIKNKFSASMEVLRIDTDRDKEITNEFEIDALPVLILYKNGVRVWIYVGLIDEEVLNAKIGSY